ncbi:MAG TPA: dihydrofolate reductase [Bacteroidia bacterium]|nr:dihydrofolate reductase [Bacteroidia bacterium]
MKISIIVAASENNAIGKNNDLLWRLPKDVKFFKEKTMGHCIVTGRKNYESIPARFRPLPGRTNIIITRNRQYEAPGAAIVHSLQEAIGKAKQSGETELFVIGGGEIFSEVFPQTDVIWYTRVHAQFDADVYFPELDPSEWKETWREEHVADEKHAYGFTFLKYERK